MDSSATGPGGRPIMLHSSLRGLLAATVTPLLLGGLGVRSWWVAGPTPGSLTLVAIAALALTASLVLLPKHVVITARGVTRVCIARRHHLSWDQVAAIERARPRSAELRGGGRAHEEGALSGGLLARSHGRRRWLLTDQLESRQEYERLHELLVGLDRPVRLRARRPHAGAPPTSLYRRQRGSSTSD
jgi:hypothetical protein